MITTPAKINEPLADVLQRCKQGKQSAYKELYHLYAGAMFNVSLRIVNKTEDAEDVLQESFVSAFKNIHQYAGESNFGTWLKRIVINKSIDFVRTKKPDLLFVEDLVNEESLEEELSDSVYEVETLRQAILKLPDGYRVILSLYVFEDFSHKMIADKLGISEGTSKSQYARAKKRLQEIIYQLKPRS